MSDDTEDCRSAVPARAQLSAFRRGIRLLFVLTALLAGLSCSGEGLELQDEQVDTTQSELAATCTIRLGEGGNTHTFSITLNDNEAWGWTSVPASDFIRSTSGPCHFRIYNSTNYTGSSVVLGTNLVDRIRAGIDGITNKDSGGGDTWRIRSLIVYRRPTTCRLNIGGSGVRMDYYADSPDFVPAMDRISYFVGGDCGANVWNKSQFAANDYDNRFKALHPSGTDRPVYDPGFGIRSMSIWNDGNTCPSFTRDQGRCLPQYTLPFSLYGPGTDGDADGLDDAYEDALAELFSPFYYNHSTEDATRTAIYTDAYGGSVTEPATIFQVQPNGTNAIKIQFMKLWLWDKWEDCCCDPHKGDSQRNSVFLRTPAAPDPAHGRLWFVEATGGGVDGDLAWSKGDASIRGVHFVRASGEVGPARHIAIYFSKGKHHEYADGGWSGQTDKVCSLVPAHVNGRGHLHNPPYPARVANVRAPANKGDFVHYNNVGTSARRFFNDLNGHGFSGECVWTCGNFYEASPANNGFQ